MLACFRMPKKRVLKKSGNVGWTKSNCTQSRCCMGRPLKLRLSMLGEKRVLGLSEHWITTTNFKRVLFHCRKSYVLVQYKVLKSWAGAGYIYGHKCFFPSSEQLAEPIWIQILKTASLASTSLDCHWNSVGCVVKAPSVFVSIIKLKWQAKGVWQKIHVCVFCHANSCSTSLKLARGRMVS